MHFSLVHAFVFSHIVSHTLLFLQCSLNLQKPLWLNLQIEAVQCSPVQCSAVHNKIVHVSAVECSA